jgi:AcrR family transcriptional regulator
MARRRSEPESRRGGSPRERILEAAVELLALHGFDAMTMRHLGARVGLDNSSLYRHFRSKSDLVDATLDKVAGDVLASIGPSIDLSRPPTLATLEDACAAVGLYFFDHPASARLMLHWIMSMGASAPGFSPSAPAADRNRPHGQLLQTVSRWLASGSQHGVLRKHAQPEAIITLFGAVLLRPATYGHLLHSLEPKRDKEAARRAWARELRAFVRGAFGA